MNGVKGRSGGARHINGNARSIADNADKTNADSGPIKLKSMTVAQRKIWEEIVSALPEESLRKLDTYLLFSLSSYIAAIQKINRAFLSNPGDPDIRQAYNQYNQKIMQLSNLFGLSPADRKRIAIGEVLEENDELKELLKKFDQESK